MDVQKVSELETLFGALADKTRLRLLNLMRNEEVCVCFFTDILKISQPKVSRHLAFLRNAGVVRARRDGKWMHYSISQFEDENASRLVESLFSWMDGVLEMRADRERYKEVCCTPEALVEIARTQITFLPASIPPEIPRRVAPHNELEEFLL
ncbi:MAG: metalloregulator ArsR/SmtB family transcription factor [Acidobacteria bacterium]|nr:metalloregulator ArsR/SmtB family transcription factor [Acidobacteriota bacterium]MCA1608625.1 metalloregulator ArsR/SmtB family transcription factor [Acidobacteriota bacterium]